MQIKWAKKKSQTARDFIVFLLSENEKKEKENRMR